MSKAKSTRSTKVKVEDEASSAQSKSVKALAFRKIIYTHESLLNKELDENFVLRLEKFFHPGKNRAALFVTNEPKSQLLEVLEFAEPRRSWLIDSDVCSNGRIYMTTEFDATFLALHHLRKHCAQRAQALDSIHDEQDASVGRLFDKFVAKDSLEFVADVKKVGDERYYKYNGNKALVWLAVKTKHIASAMKEMGIHAGITAQSANFTRSETAPDVEKGVANHMDYLRMACDYVGGYVDEDLHTDLSKYLNIPPEIQAKVEEQKAATNKRKSQQNLAAKATKKAKLELDDADDDNENQKNNDTAADKIRNCSLLDESLDDVKNRSLSDSIKVTPLKERAPSAKDKALAKSAKGTKSIASFFAKK